MKRIYKFRDFECVDGHKTHKFVEEGMVAVYCETCGDPAVLPSVAVQLSTAIQRDEVDYVDHNLGRDPIHIRSMSDRRRLMHERGLREFIRHTPVPGTDKSPFTTDWSKGSIDPYTLEAARILVSRQGAPATEVVDEIPVANPFSYTVTPQTIRDLTEAMKEQS